MTATFTPLAITVEETPEFGGGWQVRWGPAVHGGVHAHHAAAVAHAEELAAAPQWDQEAWVAAHPVVPAADVILVASASAPGTYYQVTLEGTCTCPGFYYRGTCRHLTEAGITPAAAPPEGATR